MLKLPFTIDTAFSLDVLEAFWRRVDRTGVCWVWQGETLWDGYGRFTKWVGGKRCLDVKAHVYSFAEGNPSTRKFLLAPGRSTRKGCLLVCHSCDNPACVNPNHLWLGTQLQNVQDMDAKQRRKLVRLVGRDNPMFGKTHSDEVRAICRQAALGNTTRRGATHRPDSIQKIRGSWTPERRAVQAERMRRLHGEGRRV
jgi:HNH endonuclease/NUMOD3 motif